MTEKGLKRFGNPVHKQISLEIISEDCENPSSIPGLGWKISDKTRRKIEEIDYQIKISSIHSKNLYFY